MKTVNCSGEDVSELKVMTPSRIRKIMERHGLNTADLAARLGLTERTVARWINPDWPNPPAAFSKKTGESFKALKRLEAEEPRPAHKRNPLVAGLRRGDRVALRRNRGETLATFLDRLPSGLVWLRLEPFNSEPVVRAVRPELIDRKL